MTDLSLITVIHDSDQYHASAPRRVTFLHWRVPPNVGDFVELPDPNYPPGWTTTYVVERRVWTKTQDLEIHLRRAET